MAGLADWRKCGTLFAAPVASRSGCFRHMHAYKRGMEAAISAPGRRLAPTTTLGTTLRCMTSGAPFSPHLGNDGSRARHVGGAAHSTADWYTRQRWLRSHTLKVRSSLVLTSWWGAWSQNAAAVTGASWPSSSYSACDTVQSTVCVWPYVYEGPAYDRCPAEALGSLIIKTYAVRMQ